MDDSAVPRAGRRRWCGPRLGAEDAGRAGLVFEDRLGDELLHDPPVKIRRLERALRRQVSAARSVAELSDSRLEARDIDRVPRDDGDAGAADHHQPFTPPTVMPSTKNRCANRKMTTTGSTTSVAAAISRLYATSCSLV